MTYLAIALVIYFTPTVMVLLGGTIRARRRGYRFRKPAARPPVALLNAPPLAIAC